VLDYEKAMALFDAPSLNYPTRWKEFSLDYKLGFVYFGCMTVLFANGDALSIEQELLATMFLVTILLSLSLRYRRRMNWRWPGVHTKGVLTAVGILVLAGIFDFAATPLAPPSDPRLLPWHLVGLGGTVFGVLVALRIVQLSKSDFLRECEAVGTADFRAKSTAETIPVVPTDPFWKRVTRAIYSILFLLVWLDGVASFYCFGVAFRNGSSRPTSTQTDPLNNHGQIVYIQHSQKVLIDFLQKVMFIGIPSVIVSGLILHFFLGVRLFPNTPTLQEWRKQRQRN
jgi:hypothetical protein